MTARKSRGRGPVRDRIVNVLAERQGWVPLSELREAVYAASGAKAPEREAATLAAIICNLRKAGVEIEATHCYRLRPRR